MEAELGGEISHGARAEYARVSSAPGAVGTEVFLLAAVGVVDTAMEVKFGGAALDLFQGHLVEDGDGILVTFAPVSGIEVVKDADTVEVPTPPEIPGEGPEALLRRGDEAVESTGLADDGRHLRRGFGEHPDFGVVEGARLLGLDDEDALKDTAVDDGHTQKGLVGLFAGILDELEARVSGSIRGGYRLNVLGY
jgi:hypothetical protein